MQSHRPGVSAGFHRFAVKWTPEKYVFLVDGYRYYEVTTGISHIKEYLILSMEIPSKPEEIKHTVFPDEFVVDYVKVPAQDQFRVGRPLIGRVPSRLNSTQANTSNELTT